MLTRPLGRTGLQVSELGFGAFAIGGSHSGHSYGPTDDATSVATVHAALDAGCTFFDTADVYGHGHSERLLSQALTAAGAGPDVVVATKGGARFDDGPTRLDFTPGYLRRAVEGSLRRLGVERLGVYQLHNPPLSAIRRGDAFAALDDLVEQGLVGHWGVSVHTIEEGLACIEHPTMAVLQVPLNLLTLLHDPDGWEPLLALCQERRVGVVAREPLAAGFLTGHHGEGRRYGRGDLRGAWPPERRELYVALAEALRYLERANVTLAQAALRFVLDEPGVSTTIVGAKTPQQMAENIAAVGLCPFVELEAQAAAQCLAGA